MASALSRRITSHPQSAEAETVRGGATLSLSTAGLAIKAGSSAIVKAGTLSKYLVNGTLCTLAANTDASALSGTVAADAFNVFVISVDVDGTVTSTMGTAGATIGAVKFPAIAHTSAILGFVIINPTGTGDFVGGTTALDDATVVPNAVYVNTPYPFRALQVEG
jgi:hypothetical protein